MTSSRVRRLMNTRHLRCVPFAVVVVLIMSASGLGQSCKSISAASKGRWKAVNSAPRNGTAVEMLETFGTAPTYGRFAWTRDHTSLDSEGKMVHFRASPSWVNLDKPGFGVVENDCLFWRPYKGTGHYIDPTNHQQDNVAYWCAAMHSQYDKHTDSCKQDK